MDISTVRKGPIVTIVKEDDPFVSLKSSAELMLEYRPVDVPPHVMPYYKTMIQLDNLSKFYSIYPLFKQFIGCNYYLDTHEPYSTDRIILNHLVLNKDAITENTSDKKIEKIFEKNALKTHMNSFRENTYCIGMHKHRWGFIEPTDVLDYIEVYPKSKVIICLNGLETGYVCEAKFLKRLTNLKKMGYECIFSNPEDDIYQGEIEEDLPFWDLKFESRGVIDILRSCLFIPQIMLLHQSIYNANITVKVTLKRDKELSIIIPKEETIYDENMCLFSLLKVLLERW